MSLAGPGAVSLVVKGFPWAAPSSGFGRVSASWDGKGVDGRKSKEVGFHGRLGSNYERSSM